MAFATSPIVGANLGATSTEAQFALGTRVIGDAGTEWMYVRAGSAVTQYDVVAINSSYSAVPVTSTLAGQGITPGFAQIAFAANDYGWVALKGASGLRVRTGASTVKDSLLYVGTTGLSAGQVGSTSATGRVALNGVVTVATAASAGVKPAIIATSPFFTP